MVAWPCHRVRLLLLGAKLAIWGWLVTDMRSIPPCSEQGARLEMLPVGWW